MGSVVHDITSCLPQDMFTVDEAIPNSFRSWILCLLGVLGTLFVICLATPFFTIVIIPMAIVYYFVQVRDKGGGGGGEVKSRRRGSRGNRRGEVEER